MSSRPIAVRIKKRQLCLFFCTYEQYISIRIVTIFIVIFCGGPSAVPVDVFSQPSLKVGFVIYHRAPITKENLFHQDEVRRGPPRKEIRNCYMSIPSLYMRRAELRSKSYVQKKKPFGFLDFFSTREKKSQIKNGERRTAKLSWSPNANEKKCESRVNARRCNAKIRSRSPPSPFFIFSFSLSTPLSHSHSSCPSNRQKFGWMLPSVRVMQKRNKTKKDPSTPAAR